MNYFLAVICPPVAVFLSGRRLQVIPGVALFVAAIGSLWAANNGVFMGGYAAGPVLYVFAIIHAFVLSHRFYQQQSGQTHPHRGSDTQSKL